MKIKRNYLLTIGWLLVAFVIFLSLMPLSVQLSDIKSGDKWGHFIAYFTITTWFCWLYQKKWVKNLYAIGFIIMGGVLEVLQHLSGIRTLDVNDFHMNTLGVIVGFIFSTISIHWALVKNSFLPEEKSS